MNRSLLSGGDMNKFNVDKSARKTCLTGKFDGYVYRPKNFRNNMLPSKCDWFLGNVSGLRGVREVVHAIVGVCQAQSSLRQAVCSDQLYCCRLAARVCHQRPHRLKYVDAKTTKVSFLLRNRKAWMTQIHRGYGEKQFIST